MAPMDYSHTSGSTIIPKPLVYTNATAAANTRMFSLEQPPNLESLDRIYQGKRVFLTFPPFHVREVTKSGVSTKGTDVDSGRLSCQSSL